MMDRSILFCIGFILVSTHAQTDMAGADDVGDMPANISEVPEGGSFSITCGADRFRNYTPTCVERISVSRCPKEDCGGSGSVFKDVLVFHSDDASKTVTDFGNNFQFETSKPESMENGCNNFGRAWTVLHVSRATQQDVGLYKCALKAGEGFADKEMIVRITLYKPRSQGPKSSVGRPKPAALALTSLFVALLMS